MWFIILVLEFLKMGSFVNESESTTIRLQKVNLKASNPKCLVGLLMEM